MSKQLNVVGSLLVQEGKLPEVIEILTELAQESRKEEGNIEYVVLEDTTKANTVFSIEKWENEEAEAKHWETSHLKAAFEKLGGFLAGEPTVYKGVAV